MRYSEAYFEQVEGIVSKIENSADDYEKIATRIAQRLHDGGMIYTFGTGHGHLLALEVFYRAGGLARVYPILNEDLMLHKSATESSQYERTEGLAKGIFDQYAVTDKDVMFIFSNSGINPLTIEMAECAKEKGALTVAVTNLNHSRPLTSRHKSGLKLYEICDEVIDNFGVIGDACVITDKKDSICPTSTISGSIILHTLVAMIVEISDAHGWDIEVLSSGNLPDKGAKSAAIVEKYKKVIKCL